MPCPSLAYSLWGGGHSLFPRFAAGLFFGCSARLVFDDQARLSCLFFYNDTCQPEKNKPCWIVFLKNSLFVLFSGKRSSHRSSAALSPSRQFFPWDRREILNGDAVRRKETGRPRPCGGRGTPETIPWVSLGRKSEADFILKFFRKGSCVFFCFFWFPSWQSRVFRI